MSTKKKRTELEEAKLESLHLAVRQALTERDAERTARLAAERALEEMRGALRGLADVSAPDGELCWCGNDGSPITHRRCERARALLAPASEPPEDDLAAGRASHDP